MNNIKQISVNCIEHIPLLASTDCPKLISDGYDAVKNGSFEKADQLSKVQEVFYPADDLKSEETVAVSYDALCKLSEKHEEAAQALAEKFESSESVAQILADAAQIIASAKKILNKNSGIHYFCPLYLNGTASVLVSRRSKFGFIIRPQRVL